MSWNWAALVFFALAGILLSGCALCCYEGFSLLTGRDPTISRITAYQFQTNPHLYMIGVFVFGVIFGSLVTHFTNWRVK